MRGILTRPAVVAFIALFVFSAIALAGSLTPPGAVSSTMHTLQELYDSIAGTFDSSAIVANQNGSLIQNLKYIEANILWASGSNNIWNLNSGNVGIGTTSVDAKLEVAGTASISGATILNGVSYTWPTTQGGAGTVLTNNAGTLSWATPAGGGGSVSSGSLDFDEFVNNMTLDANTHIASAGFTLTTSANVGIGTSAPFAPMTVVGRNPVLVSSVSIGADNVQDITVQGNYVFTNHNNANNFHIFDATNPAAPVQIASMSFGLNNSGSNAVIQGNYAYVVYQNGLTNFGVLDISNPKSPNLVATSAQIQNMRGIAVQGKYLYVLSSGGSGPDFSIWDISNPRNPLQVYGSDLVSGSKIIVQGRYAYIAGTTGATSSILKIVDVGNVQNPRLVGQSGITEFNQSGKIALQDHFAFVTRTASGINQIVIYDVINPASPSAVALFQASTAPTWVAVNGRYLYAAYNSTVNIIDISTITAPTLVGSFSALTQFDIRDRYLYGTTGSSLQIYDLGGGYFNVLSAGSLASDILTVKNNTQVQGSIHVRGAAVLGAGAYLSGPLGISASTSNAFTLTSTANADIVLHSILPSVPTGTDGKFTIRASGSAGIDQLRILNGSGTALVTIASLGNVGIGESNPGVLLSLKGLPDGAAGGVEQSRDLIRLFDTSATAQGVGGGLSFGGQQTAGVYAQWAGLKGIKENSTDNNNAGALVFWTKANAGARADKMRISSDGNLGVGATSPEQKLNVAGSIIASASGNVDLILNSLSNQDGNWTLRATSTDGFQILGSASQTLLTIASSGNVGIGTPTPALKLHVLSASDTDILRLQDSDGTCDHNPEAGSEVVTCSSDQSLKSNIQDAPSVLAYLSDFRIRAFTVNASQERITGVIAQEVQRTHPELVSMGADGLLMVSQPNPWLIVKAIQELDTRIDTLSESGPVELDSEYWINWDFKKLFARIVEKFNGLVLKVKGLDADEVQTKKLCIGDTCVNERQLKQFINSQQLH